MVLILKETRCAPYFARREDQRQYIYCRVENPFCVSFYTVGLASNEPRESESIIQLFCTLFSGSRNNKTFKPKKHIPEGTHQYDLMKHAAATLGSGNLRQAVMLPEGEDLNEWVAVNSEYYHKDLYMPISILIY